MERLAETKARENITKSSKQKSSPLEYFKEKHDKELDLKSEEKRDGNKRRCQVDRHCLLYAKVWYCTMQKHIALY